MKPNQTKPTPGPWHVNSLETVKRTIHSTGGHVATAEAGSMLELSPDQIEANARLIAASPTLYLFAVEMAASGNERAKSMLASLKLIN